MKKNLSKGFTLIELLIVIAVLGILAVAVLSAINPIEQINRSRDTGSRSDAEQLLGAIDRFYATAAYYPWRTGASGGSGVDAQDWTEIKTGTWLDSDSKDILEKLSGTAVGSTAELKTSFTSRITGPGYNYLWVYNMGGAGDSTYVCFNSTSNAFQAEAKERCGGTKGSIPTDLNDIKTTICGATIAGKTGPQYLTCLP